ncbi:hypothetical protein FACS1894137_13170 [Spirochaetia bacterium]|nr:hypothetical protein FACS1894137_13170 [Spirochaetia bacterium]
MPVTAVEAAATAVEATATAVEAAATAVEAAATAAKPSTALGIKNSGPRPKGRNKCF